jgi:2'-hydroxyisoflavone reductase
MSNRRDFMLRSVAAAGALAAAVHQTSAAGELLLASKAMRILFLGGTGFIGPHFVRAALERGHEVSVFTRGSDDSELPKSVRRLVGDRNGDLRSIRNRDWDAVFDLATYVPSWVRSLGGALEGRVGHYTFISTIITYKYPGAVREESDVVPYTGTVDPYSLTSHMPPMGQYGALKVLCEDEAEKQFPLKTLVLRLGHIVGPRERTGALTYWVARMAKGGEILVGGEYSTPVQLIDVRDVAEWSVRMSEERHTGTFNTVGPAMSMTWGEMLGALRGAFAAPTRLTWVPKAWLIERKLPSFSALLFWPGESGGISGIWNLSNDKARAHGLTFRSLNTTIADTWAWYMRLSREQKMESLLLFNEKSPALDDAIVEERKLLAAWNGSRCSESHAQREQRTSNSPPHG